MPAQSDQPYTWLIPFLLVLGGLTVILVVLLAYGLGPAAATAAAVALGGAATRVVRRLANKN